MIPSIETIVRDLAAGLITPAKALAWLNEHQRLAASQWDGLVAGGHVVAHVEGENDVAMIEWTEDYRPSIGDLIYAMPLPKEST